MPAKKQKPQQKSNNKPDKKLLTFAEAVAQYYDYKDIDYSKLPKTLPKKFPLKIGNTVVGKAYVDWQRVFSKLFSMSASLSKPPDKTEDEHAEMLIRLWDAVSPETRETVIRPFFLMLFYMFRFTPATLGESLRHLSNEAFYDSIFEKRHWLIRRFSFRQKTSLKKFSSKSAKQCWTGCQS